MKKKIKVLYHGSKSKLKGENLIPLRAKDLGKNKYNSLEGIYATDNKEIAIAMALVNEKNVNAKMDFSEKPVKVDLIKGELKKKTFYLYTLPSKGFVNKPKGSNQWISFNSVRPKKIEKLKSKDYEHLIRKPIKVLLAMSGGVDSSVAALMMKKKGYEIIGAFMKNWSDTKDESGECNWKAERNMAIKIAKKLEIPLITLDFEKQYKRDVVEKMFKDYKKGITPNPDVDCNQKVKFPLLIKEAKKLGADYVVTGHYSRIKRTKNKYELLRAKDESKDQSYFLYRLNQNELKHVLFPIGDYTKKDVRKIAEENNFPNFDKKSTVGICFIGNIDFKKFLKEKIKEKKGKILSPEGKVIGEHNGVYYYTIGERLGPRYGFEISKDSDDKKNLKRWYVARKNLRKNEIIAAPQNHPLLYKKEIIIRNFHCISENKEDFKKSISKNSKRVLSRIRQVGELLPSKISYDKKKKQIKLTLNKAITGVSQGQAIVLYKGENVLGGGEIRF